ncbi:phospholipase D/Transphosphatidylase [Geobacter metallireducens RCH3]|uniref:Cardiolipin synthase, putative n=1 Tax=Geobacter metallireducens (strain ATCC 53774 / DSM 7210 / GS-15) TaxID=269799 RepID=Q39R32_GEOMG|nr:phospholipase D-like domain-containing protein [Geobacter metallireducens]ABB33292.1 cardiolipin synthase, putative [Geobacter metallireducens GS-15]EHP85870.1 phospholipase D/Transphosphatidylase [Geobacter metallireducens RCH3]
MSIVRRKKIIGTHRAPRFLRIFRRNAEASHSRGNRVKLYDSGAEFFPAMLSALAEARHHIHAEFYIVRDDATGSAFAEALLAAASRRVDVSLIYDYIGCFDTPSSYFRRLEQGGVRCLAFNPPPFRRGLAWFDKRDHRKMAVIDGETAFTGGINIGDEYSGFGRGTDRWRDVGVRIDGPAVTDLVRLFREFWLEEKGSPSPAWFAEHIPVAGMGDADVMIVSDGPHHARSFIRNAFRIAMAGAGESIRIMNPYFVPGPRVVRSLLRAVRRGVNVQLILPAKSDVPIVRLVGRGYYAPLLRAGVEIYERQGEFLHAKVMLIDDTWGVVGSANLDQRSFHRNYEVNTIVASREFGRQMAEMFADDLRGSRRIVLEEHERRGSLVRLLERICNSVSWFL